MKNTGWELSLNTINLDMDGFRWTSNFNFGYNYNEILDAYSTPTYSSMTNGLSGQIMHLPLSWVNRLTDCGHINMPD